MEAISDYGILGYGIDILNNQPLKRIINYTYNERNTFEFQKKILIPDQYSYDPTPVHQLTELRSSGVMQTSREFQISLGRELGLGGVVDGVEFSGQASSVNSLFEQETTTTARYYIETAADYVILTLNGGSLKGAANKDVTQAAKDALDGSKPFEDFFKEWGTHIVQSASVGGEMRVKTSVSLNVSSSKKISQNKINLEASAKSEAGGYANGKFDFDQRSTTEDKVFRENTSVSVLLKGGMIASKGFTEWRDSLNASEIFSQPVDQEDMRPHDEPMLGAQQGKLYLGLGHLKYVPLHSVLDLSTDETTRFDAALKTYLGGKNPFATKVQTLTASLAESKEIKLGNKARFTMRGWMATYETYACLTAKPGAYATIACKSDAEPGGWTEKTVYAGETVKLRGKTPYMSKYMDVKFLSIHGDDPKASYLKAHARNKLVSW
ncbi:MAC/perforin domain-containing protein [Roseovarius phycicola]|uniref:MAC/perforin domain-containing protein n=1 Tax=Roseovarius phycicola TaxID=3080976 RepID=A0ABZ2HQQ2_9RHOB